MKSVLKLLRVKHYIKNLLILLPAFLVGELLNPLIFFKNICGVIIFSCLASVVYIINDIRDVEADRQHPTKCQRPIASGAVSISQSCLLIGVLVFLALLISICSDDFSGMIHIPILYLILNILYSFGLKNYPLVDVFILMLGYLLRLVYGGELTNCGVSSWMFLTMMSVSFFMGFGKRRGELREYGDGSRKNLKQYTESFLNQSMIISCTLAVVFYAMTCTDTDSSVAQTGVDLLWSVPGIVIILFRYLMLILSGENDGDPITVITADKPLLCMGIGFSLILFILLYVK